MCRSQMFEEFEHDGRRTIVYRERRHRTRSEHGKTNVLVVVLVSTSDLGDPVMNVYIIS
jgi:hypothetical protein